MSQGWASGPLRLAAREVAFPLRAAFTIARGSKSEARVVEVVLTDADGHTGRGEAVPYPRYGDTPATALAGIERVRAAVEAGIDRAALQTLLPPSAARNALDCALWDLEAKQTGRPVWQLAGLPEAPAAFATAVTLSLDTPERMAEAAAKLADHPLLKIKLTGEGDLLRIRAIRRAAPTPRLIVDANEGWSPHHVEVYADSFADYGVELIEQPLPASADAALAGIRAPIALAADESMHDLASLERLIGLYQVVNIKLDKTGGLTEALKVKAAAEAAGLKVMIGCMVASSLAMAPAALLTPGAMVADLDGPWWLAADRPHGMAIERGIMAPPDPRLWG